MEKECLGNMCCGKLYVGMRWGGCGVGTEKKRARTWNTTSMLLWKVVVMCEERGEGRRGGTQDQRKDGQISVCAWVGGQELVCKFN